MKKDIETSKEFSTTLDILKGVDLIKPGDFDYLAKHKNDYQKRLRTRSLYRSKFEMQTSVLSKDTHPTPDSAYWQAIGEQAVQVEQLIQLSYENKKLHTDISIAEADIEEFVHDLTNLESKHSSERPWELKRLKAKIERREVDLEQMQMGDIMQRKMAQERMREIRDWEDIIQDLLPKLEFGTEDFSLMHPKRYALRYKRKVERLNILGSDERSNAISHYANMMAHPDNVNLVSELKKSGELPLQELIEKYANSNNKIDVVENQEGFDHTLRVLEQPKESAHIEVSSRSDLTKDPVVDRFYNRTVTKFLIGAPHRTQNCNNITRFGGLQIPAGCEAHVEQPFGFSVPDARNMIVKRALSDGYDYIFFLDDDVWAPRNAIVKLYSLKENVAGGVYYRKYTPLETVGMYEDEKGRPSSLDNNYAIGDLIHHTLVLPSGLTLIKSDVFKQMIPNWKDQELPQWYRTYSIKGMPQITEDTYICQRFRDIGVDIITDTSVQGIHVDKKNGVYYAHPEIVTNNIVNEGWRNYFAI